MKHPELVAEKAAAIQQELTGSPAERLAQLRVRLEKLLAEYVEPGTPASSSADVCSRGGLQAVAEHHALTDMIRTLEREQENPHAHP